MLTIMLRRIVEDPPVKYSHCFPPTTSFLYTVLCGTEVIYQATHDFNYEYNWGVVAHTVLSVIYELADPEDENLGRWLTPDGNMRIVGQTVDDRHADPNYEVLVYNRISHDSSRLCAAYIKRDMIQAMINNGLTPDNVQFCKVSAEKIPFLRGGWKNRCYYHDLEWTPPHVGWRPPRSVVKNYIDRMSCDDDALSEA